MNVISSSIAAEIDSIVALSQSFGVFNGNGLPGFAAVHRDIVVARRPRSWRSANLEGCPDNVVGVLRIDGDSHFGRIDCVRAGDSKDFLRRRLRRKETKNENEWQNA